MKLHIPYYYVVILVFPPLMISPHIGVIEVAVIRGA